MGQDKLEENLISVIIPSYNRKEYLKKSAGCYALPLLMPEIKFHHGHREDNTVCKRKIKLLYLYCQELTFFNNLQLFIMRGRKRRWETDDRP